MRYTPGRFSARARTCSRNCSTRDALMAGERTLQATRVTPGQAERRAPGSLVVARRAQTGPRVHPELVVDERQVLLDGHRAQLDLLLLLDPRRGRLPVHQQPQVALLRGEDLSLRVRDHVLHLLRLEVALAADGDAVAAILREEALLHQVVAARLV